MKGRWKGYAKRERGEEERGKKSEREKDIARIEGRDCEHAREWMLFHVNGYLAGRNLIYSVWTSVWKLFRSNTGTIESIEYHLPWQSSNSFRSPGNRSIFSFFFFSFFIYIYMYTHQISYIRRSMNRYVVNYVHLLHGIWRPWSYVNFPTDT